MSEIEEPQSARSKSFDELSYRLKQQSILAEFGSEALRAPDLNVMLDRAVALAAAGMRTSLAKITRYQADEQKLLVVAGVGWKPGIVGRAWLNADRGSPTGFAFWSSEPVICNRLDSEDKFRRPDFMIEHGVTRAINIVVEVEDKNWGVLEVDSTRPGEFSVADLAFMRGFAHLIGVAIERHLAETKLRCAKQYQELLTREASHRVKNSLSIVSALLGMEKSGQSDPQIVNVLNDAQDRIKTIALTHDLLWRGKTVGVVELSQMICSLADNLSGTAPSHEIDCRMEPLSVNADLAVSLGLIVNELVTNAIKYAYGAEGGRIFITGFSDGESYVVEVRDEGAGFPEELDTRSATPPSLGLRLVRAAALQLGAEVEFSKATCGALVTIRMPLPDDISSQQFALPAKTDLAAA